MQANNNDNNNNSDSDSANESSKQAMVREGYQPIGQETHDNENDNDFGNGNHPESGDSYEFTDALNRSNNSNVDVDIDIDMDIQTSNQTGEELLSSSTNTNTASALAVSNNNNNNKSSPLEFEFDGSSNFRMQRDRDLSLEQSEDFMLSERGAAVVKAAAATTLVRSDSVLSRDEDDDDDIDCAADDNYNDRANDHDHAAVVEDDEDYDSHAAEQTQLLLEQRRNKDRAMSFVYMEECSMEAALQDYPGDAEYANGDGPAHAGLHETHTGSGESGVSGVSGGSLTKIMPSGRLGRRRTSASESDMILVVDDDLEEFSSSQSHLTVPTEEEEEDKVYKQLNEHLHEREQGQDLDESERDVFQTVPVVAVFQPTLDVALTEEPPPEPMPVTAAATTTAVDTAIATDLVDVSRAPVGREPSTASPSPPPPPPIIQTQTVAAPETVRHVLQAYNILPSDNNQNNVSNNNNHSKNNHNRYRRMSSSEVAVAPSAPASVDEHDEQAAALHSLFEGFCIPPVELSSVKAILQLEWNKDYSGKQESASVALPDQPVVVMNQPDNRVVSLLTAGSATKPALLQLPIHFAAAFVRLLVRLLTHESDVEYNVACLLVLEWKNHAKFPPAAMNLSEEPPADPDHATLRSHLLYSMARFQCTSQWSLSSTTNTNAATSANGNTADTRPAVTAVLTLWERVVERKDCGRLIAPVARLLALLATAGVTPRILRRMLSLAQNSAVTPVARLCMVKALKTAAAGSSRPAVLSKAAPRHFFSFGGQGLCRTISGLTTWPFRNDFGMAVWFRVERFDSSSKPILLSARSDDGGGVEVSLVPLGDQPSDACTVAVSLYNSGREKRPVHCLKVSGCVLLPQVWYHLAVRHTRSRLKGVFSLSTRQHLSIMLDGKTMLTESLPFPKVLDADFREDSTSSLLPTTLRRKNSHSSINLSLEFCNGFDGQTGALYLFNDNVSDASFRALFDATGGYNGILKRNSSLGESWDARRSNIVRKSRILDVNITNDDAEEIVLSQRRRSGSRKRGLAENLGSVVDLAENEEQEINDIPGELQKASFGSKVFLVWDPRRTLESLALELHVGAHVNMDNVYTWTVNGVQDVISSIGGVQALVPLFRSLLAGEIEKSWSATTGNGTEDLLSDMEVVLSTIPDLILLLSAFVQDHSDNARELLRCGGVDVIEQLLFTNKKAFAGRPEQVSFFGSLNTHIGLATQLAAALLKLRAGSSHYGGLETKIFSRLFFNIPLWLGEPSQAPGLGLLITMLPLLSTLTRMNAEKVRDCVGVKGMVYAVREFSSLDTSAVVLDRLETKELNENRDTPFTITECSHVADILLGMIFGVLVSGTSPTDLAPFLHFIAFRLDAEFDEATQDTTEASSSTNRREEQLELITKACTVLLFLLQIRPPVPGLFESFAHCCGSVQGGVGWILSAMVNTFDDRIRSLGVRSVSAYLDFTSRSPDAPLSLGALLQPSEAETPSSADVSSSVRQASNRFPLIAKGLAAMGPGVRAIVVTPSKLTARVVFKLLWHLLKSHRSRLGIRTRAALLHLITDDNGIFSSSLSSIDFLQIHLVEPDGIRQQSGFKLRVDWAETLLAETGNTVGRSLRDPLAIGTVLRLLRYLDGTATDHWVSDLLSLANSSRKSISMLSSIADWQPSLFHLISETLEQVISLRDTNGNESSDTEKADAREVVANGTNGSTIGVQKHVYDRNQLPNAPRESPSSLGKRLDLCLELYSSLLGHLLREGGDKALEAVENAASLQRVCLNGNDVLLLILSSLCANVYDNGTLLEMGAFSAQDWKFIDLEEDSLPLKQSARLVTDSILSNGTKGLDMTAAVRSWRSLRHLIEVTVALVTKSGLGVVDLFDYSNHQASAVDSISGGLHGIRLPDSRLSGIRATEYVFYRGAVGGHHTQDTDVKREIDRRLCVTIAAQMLTLLDAFIFPESLDPSLPASQLHGLALVRNSEPRLGNSQGPLISSAIRLSLLLLALLEPCSVRFLQCASRLRCLLYWALELLRELVELEASSVAAKDGVNSIDRLVLAIVLHCHRALGRCAALLAEIESSSHQKYFLSKEAHKKHFRRLLRVGLELRDIVSTVYRGRNELLRATLSAEAYESLRVSLEGPPSSGRSTSKESVIRDFMSSRWVTGFQDIETRIDLAIPEQVAMDTMIPLSSAQGNDPSNQGFLAVENLANESNAIIKDFEKALDGCFEEYLEGQRKWAETDAVRDLECDGDTTVKRLAEKYRNDAGEMTKTIALRRSGADNRWRGIQRSVIEPWKNQTHWKLARYTDPLGRRTVLVQNIQFDNHREASYGDIMEKEREKEERKREARLLEKKELSDVMRRNADAFVVHESSEDPDTRDDDSSLLRASDGESSTDHESITEEDDSNNAGQVQIDESDQDEEWDKIDAEEIDNVNAEGDIDGWAKAFIWSDSESVVARFDHVMIVSLQTFVEGKLLLTTHGLYFHQVGDEIVIMTKEPVDSTESANSDAKDRRWRLTRLTEVHGRRFMLRPQALELFFSDSHELFLNFPVGNKERDRFHAKLRNSCKVPMLWSPKSLNPRALFRKNRLTELWTKRKISNFQYIMALNRMAGRSFNDLTQYPVFPWVLADYTSEKIDLTDSRVFRDLSKPIGALDPNRLAQLIERYNELELFGFTEAEKFLYGSHYSSPGTVLHYLIRQEPFTTMAIELQSGRFDCPDRLFYDIAGTWKGILSSTSDFKELTPEWFCLPEMFLNTNEFPLGETQSGKTIDNVILPPWAKGSAFEFVRIHRLALESDYVSQNLHHWIDLIFGYQQRGPESEAAHNIFHHLSYEGSVDLDKITDEIDRMAAETHIQNFGQTPSQLTATDPHPARYTAEECWKPLIYDNTVPKSLRCYTASKQFGNKSSEYAKGAVLKIHVLSDSIHAVYADMSVGTYRWFPAHTNNRLRMDRLRPLARRELSMSRIAMKRGSAIPVDQIDNSDLAIGNWSFGMTIGGVSKEQLRRKAVLPPNRLISGSETTLASAEASSLLVSCGYWDGTLKVHSSDTWRVIASETGGHNGPIRCLAMGQDGGLMVTGGQDGTCRVWVVDHPDMAIALSDAYVQTALGASNDGEQLLSCCHVLWGHESPITCVVLNSDMDVSVSGSQSGLLCVHSLRRGEFIHSFRPPTLSSHGTSPAVSKLALATTGTLVVSMEDGGLHTFTINGVRLCSVEAGDKLHDIKLCSNGEMLVTGGDRCQVLIRTTVDLQVCAMLDLGSHGPIRCLALTPDDLNPVPQFLFIGSEDGSITVVDQDPMNQQNDSGTVSF